MVKPNYSFIGRVSFVFNPISNVTKQGHEPLSNFVERNSDVLLETSIFATVVRSGQKSSREPFGCKDDVLPPVGGDVFNCADTDLCSNFTTRRDVNCIQSTQPDSGAMTTN